MDDFYNTQNEEPFNSLADALYALNFSLCEEMNKHEVLLKNALTATPQNAVRISRLAGHLLTIKYVRDKFMEMEDRFTPAELKVAAFYDDPAYLPELMDGALLEMKFMQASSSLLKSSMVLLPGQMETLAAERKIGPKITLPDLNRHEVAAGNGKALEWLETDLFPLFKEFCPPPNDRSPPSLPWQNPSL